MSQLHVLSVASEIFPLVKTGGLADVVGALPAAFAREGIACTTLVPGYPEVLRSIGSGEVVHTADRLFGGPARVVRSKAGGVDLLVIDAPHLYAREGLPYTGPDGRDWPDNAERFAALGLMAARIGQGLLPDFAPNVLHAHDWQAGLAPAYLHYQGGSRPGVVATVHNMAFQGLFPAETLERLGLPPSAMTIDGIEFYGQISFLKGALQFADRVTTVSPTYAKEIQTAEAGMGLQGLLQARSAVVSGILNGIDEDVWNPAQDPYLAARYDRSNVKLRALNKAHLQHRMGLREDPEALVFGVVSRLSSQKGLDLVLANLGTLLDGGAQLVLLGAGDPHLEDGFRRAAEAHPDQVAPHIGFDEGLAHQIQGGCDALLVPSRFEPCGLTQLCALRYGAVPVVARVGGLADTVTDAGETGSPADGATGIQFTPVDESMFADAIRRTRALWQDRSGWRVVQQNGMQVDVGWSTPAKQYAALYHGLV